MRPGQEDDSGTAPYPGGTYPWLVVAILLIIFSVAFLDRVVMSILVVPMQRDLGINDLQAGILMGPAFVLSYALAGMAMGYLADHHNRRLLLFGGVALWGTATFASGLLESFSALLVARMLVGLGESCIVPATFSLLADYFPPNRLGRASAVVTIGNSVGAGGALLGGGAVLAVASTQALVPIDLFSRSAPWQQVLLLFGSLSLVAALLVMMIREPERRRGDAPVADHPRAGRFLPFALQNRRAILLILAPYILVALCLNAVSAWIPTVLVRKFALEPGEAAMSFGLITVAVVPFAAIGGGYAADRLSEMRRGGRYLLIPALAPFAALGVTLIWLSAEYWLAMAGLVLIMAVGSGLSNSVFAAITEISPPAVRGQFLGLYAVLASLIPVGLGTTVVPLVNDRLFGEPAMLDASLALLCVPCILLALACIPNGRICYERLRSAR